MAKPKAPRWLTEAFRDGVDEREGGPFATCQLARHDPLELPCSGRLERFHYINRQRVENALKALFYNPVDVFDPQSIFNQGDLFTGAERKAVILLAAWDPRNGGIGCEGHHRRLDNHATPELVIPKSALPDHVLEFANDWGLESSLEERFPVEIGA